MSWPEDKLNYIRSRFDSDNKKFDACHKCMNRNKPVSVCINCTQPSIFTKPSRYQYDYSVRWDMESDCEKTKELAQVVADGFKEGMESVKQQPKNHFNVELHGDKYDVIDSTIERIRGTKPIVTLKCVKRETEDNKEKENMLYTDRVTVSVDNEEWKVLNVGHTAGTNEPTKLLIECIKTLKTAIPKVVCRTYADRIDYKFRIKDVKFNPPATIVFWEDGTKTVVKCENEVFDPEKGLAMAISKKALGNKYEYFNHFKRWTKKYYKTHDKFVAKNPPQVEFTMTGCSIDAEELGKLLGTTKDGKKLYLNPNRVPKDDEV